MVAEDNTSFITQDNDGIRNLVESLEYSEVFKYGQDELSKILSRKTSIDLLTECRNCKVSDVYNECESMKRLIVILTIYKILINSDKLWRQISLIPILTFKNIYTLSQINNDFIHIKDHIDRDDKFEKELHSKLKLEFKCIDFDKCHGYRRWRNRLIYSYRKTLNNQDIVFQEECDKIHSYLIHYEMEEKHINHLQNGNIEKSGKGYIGEKEDDEWYDYKMDNDEMDEMDESIYGDLVYKMGIFRCQCAHGFSSKQHRGLIHLKPKYKNIKQEVLENSYYRLSTDNWNQTLRKSTVFFKSFARQRIKTWYDGKYDDQVTQQISKWKKDEYIDMQEIVILKLYTDFDKLQYELKKCFRFETIDDIFTLKNFDPNNKYKYKYDLNSNINININNRSELRYKLEMRLQTFYWWRIGLLTVLNKYGESLNNNNKVALYHGVNSKMIINNGKIDGTGFYGPLSTSTSYHVARTFATAKGMVLQISSQYPRLSICRGFDASLISDYPEEKEWLIGFMYIRINSVLTRPLNKNWKTFDDIDKKQNYYQIPLSSITRSIFFAIHLFRQQIFSMSPHLQYWLAAFLYLCCKNNNNNNNNKLIKKINFVKKLEKTIINKKYNHRHDRILNILWKQFNKFRKYPNKNQLIKMDQISDNLKPYFLDYDGKDINKNEKYIISFIKIIKIFENVEKIHFTNTYLFDNIALNKLIAYIDKNPNHKLKQIKFLYFDYQTIKQQNSNDKTPLYPMNSQIFFDPQQLDQTLVTKLKEKNWEIKHKNIGKTGYEIQLYSKPKELKSTLSTATKPFATEANPNITPKTVTDAMKSTALQKANEPRTKHMHFVKSGKRFNGG